jgi:putative peptidoglycan lipid II flippase
MKKQALDSLVVSALSAISLSTAVMLYRLVARRFGPNDTDAFFLAFGVLNVLIVPAYNAISSTLVPTVVRRATLRPRELPVLLGAALSWTICASLVATIVVAIFALYGLRLFVNGLPGAPTQLVARDVVILGPLITFQAVGAVVGAASQAAGRYWAPAGASLCQQALTIILVANGLPVPNAVLLPLAFTLGALGNLVFLIGFWPWRQVRIAPSLRAPADLTSSLRFALPLVYGTVAIQLGLFGLRLFASRLAPGSVTAFDLAYRVAIALVEVCASGVLAVTLTQWSAAVVAGQTESLRSRLRDTLALVLFVILPLPVALHALRVPLVTLWLSSSAAGPAITAMTIAALGIFLLGVPLDVAGRLYTRVLIARERTDILGWLSLQRMIITLVFGALLVLPLGIRGVVLSDTLAILVTLVSLHWITTGSLGWSQELAKGSFPRLAIAVVVAWGIAKMISSMSILSSPWVQCALGATAALSAYLGVARILRIPELTTVMALFRAAGPRNGQPQPASANAQVDT